MDTQELRNKTDNILGNSLRVLLPSYWWKKLFHHVADTIDGNEQLIIESFKEFKKKYPDIASRTFYITIDENSEEAAHNVLLGHRFFLNLLMSVENGTKFHNDPYYLAIPLTEDDEALEYDIRLITCPQYSFADGGIAFWDVGIGEKLYIVVFPILGNGVQEILPLSGSTSIIVDSSVSTTSTHPVQNKAITRYVDDLTMSIGNSNYLYSTPTDIRLNVGKGYIVDSSSNAMPAGDVVITSLGGAASYRDRILVFFGATSLTIPSDVLWENGVVPTIDPDATYVLNIKSTKGTGDTPIHMASLKAFKAAAQNDGQ